MSTAYEYRPTPVDALDRLRSRLGMVPDVSTRVETITPDMAREYLSHNIQNNRNPKRIAIEGFARDMAAGKWRMTGEAIKFDDGGNLIDGQNRLLAIIRAGVSVQILVIRGLDHDAVTVVDSGTKRSVADAITVAQVGGQANPRDVAAVVRLHHAWKHGQIHSPFVSVRGIDAPTNTEALVHLEKHPELIRASMVGKLTYGRLKTSPAALGTCYALFSERSESDTEIFYGRIHNGISTGTGDPLLTLSRRVMDDHKRNRMVGSSMAMYYLIRTWNAFREGDSFQRFVFTKSDGTPMPMPQIR